MSSFIGTEMRKFDQVNRMSIPPQFRNELGSPVVIMKSLHNDPCLLIFSEKEYDRFSKGIVRTYKGEMQARAQRQLANRIDLASVDKSGRISLKEDFKKFAQLNEEMIVVGMDNRIELWDKNIWDEYNDSGDFDFSDTSYSNDFGDAEGER